MRGNSEVFFPLAVLLTFLFLSGIPANAETCADCQAYCRHVLSDCIAAGQAQSDCEGRYTECMQGCDSRCSQSGFEQRKSKQNGDASQNIKAANDSDKCCCLTAGVCEMTVGRVLEWSDKKSCQNVSQCCDKISGPDCK